MYEVKEYLIVGVVAYIIGFLSALLIKKSKEKEEVKEALSNVKSVLESVNIHFSESETERMAMLENQDNIQKMIKKLKKTVFDRYDDEQAERTKEKKNNTTDNKINSIKKERNEGGNLE